MKVFRNSILFCKYLCNWSLELYEICNFSSLGSNWPINKFVQSGINMCMRDKICACVCTRLCAQIFIKIYVWLRYHLMSLRLKFQKDPSFLCGDICLFENFNFQCIFHNYTFMPLKGLQRWIIVTTPTTTQPQHNFNTVVWLDMKLTLQTTRATTPPTTTETQWNPSGTSN